MPPLPPIMGADGQPDGQKIHLLNVSAAKLLNDLRVMAWDVMFRTVSGFMEQPERMRLAWYLQREPLIVFFSQPNVIPAGGNDPETGEALQPTQAPPLMEINRQQCEKMLMDAALLYEKYVQQPVMPAMPMMEPPI